MRYMSPVILLAPLIITAVIAWQVVTGKILRKNWRLWTTRQESPTLFWLMIGVQSLVAIWAWYKLLPMVL